YTLPYTTLFRSRDTGVLVRRVAGVLLPAADQLQDDMEGAGVPGAAPRALAAALAGPESPRRRRYTRLDHAHGAHRVAVQAQTDPGRPPRHGAGPARGPGGGATRQHTHRGPHAQLLPAQRADSGQVHARDGPTHLPLLSGPVPG